MVFWILFFIILIVAFFVLLPKVKKAGSDQSQTTTEQPTPQRPPDTTPPDQSPPPPPPQRQDTTVETPTREPVQETASPERPVGQTTPQPERQTITTPPTTANQSPPVSPPVETRDRSIYFIQETRGGAELIPVKVTRKIPVSDSPLLDCLNALLAGPTAEEQRRGIIDCMPPGTRVISALVRGNTAYINFNEQFQYNTGGREDYAAQIKQIVWTATEFPNVHDVQMLIEGSIVNYLGEGIRIGSPLRR
jgi:spore germination protein GerM